MTTRLAALVTPFDAVRVGCIDLVPLIARGTMVLPELDLLEDALRAGSTEITEVSERGVVGEVLVKHAKSARAPLLLLDGEEIVGAKQNRTFNGSFIVEPGSEVRIPVCCVEKGRWRHEGDGKFASESRTVVTSVRAEKVRGTAKTLVGTGSYSSDQASVWTSVSKYSEMTRISSRTESLSETMVARVAEIRSQISAIEIHPGQIGLAAVANGRMLGADIVGSPALYRRVHRKIALGFAAEIVEDRGRSASAPYVVLDALADVSREVTAVKAAPGRGSTVVTCAPMYVATELVDGDTPIHAVVVPA